MPVRKYGEWEANPTRCIQEVKVFTGSSPFQCSRKRGKGKDGLYCAQHAKKHPAIEGHPQAR